MISVQIPHERLNADYMSLSIKWWCRALAVTVSLSVNDARGQDARPDWASHPPISIHPENAKYFLFRNRPLVLITATEHYGSVLNRPFDFDKYLADAAEKRQTLTRTFMLFRELQTVRNPSSPCKPESPDYIAPWPRTGPGIALDGEPQFDVDQWNPEFFERLHRFLTRAAELGIVVELTLFSNAYTDRVWALQPLNGENNLQRVGRVPFSQYTSLHDEALLERQLAYVAKIVQETSRYDNVYYEICNEPGACADTQTSAADVDAWQARMARAVRDELNKLDRKHLVFGCQANDDRPQFQKLDESFSGRTFDVVNVHPLPNTVLNGRAYGLGNFMSKELALREFREFCHATQAFGKPCVSDEDNTATLYRDDVGWTIHRKRAWTALLCQTHYDFIDFSVTVGNETGTTESNRKIRTWMKHLSEFIHAFDFIRAKPLEGWIEECPPHLVASVLAIPGEDYAAYLADDREVTDPTAGKPISGNVSFQLPAGNYGASLYSPITGEASPAVRVQGGQQAVVVSLPPFVHDIVLRVVREH